MIVLAQINCPACRVNRSTCNHPQRGRQYVEYFNGKYTMVTSKLDDARTFSSEQEALDYYETAKLNGATSTGWKVVKIGS